MIAPPDSHRTHPRLLHVSPALVVAISLVALMLTQWPMPLRADQPVLTTDEAAMLDRAHAEMALAVAEQRFDAALSAPSSDGSGSSATSPASNQSITDLLTRFTSLYKSAAAAFGEIKNGQFQITDCQVGDLFETVTQTATDYTKKASTSVKDDVVILNALMPVIYYRCEAGKKAGPGHNLDNSNSGSAATSASAVAVSAELSAPNGGATPQPYDLDRSFSANFNAGPKVNLASLSSHAPFSAQTLSTTQQSCVTNYTQNPNDVADAVKCLVGANVYLGGLKSALGIYDDKLQTTIQGLIASAITAYHPFTGTVDQCRLVQHLNTFDATLIGLVDKSRVGERNTLSDIGIGLSLFGGCGTSGVTNRKAASNPSSLSVVRSAP